MGKASTYRHLTEGREARFRCRVRPKYRYETLEEAWVAAFYLYGMGIAQHIMTPYKCGIKYELVPEVRWVWQPNPWAWHPPKLQRILLRRTTRRLHPCGGWHLTRKSHFMLPA